MAQRKILVLNGHPGATSLNKSLVESYRDAATNAGHDIRYHDISQMQFDADFGQGGFRNSKPWEPDVERFANDLVWADHVVLGTPLWWGSLPAKLKGLIDRALLPGHSFEPHPTKNTLPKPLLTGKTARVLMTSDTPGWFFRLMYSNAMKKILTRQIFAFVGIKPTKFTNFAQASHPKESEVKSWLAQAENLGRAGL